MAITSKGYDGPIYEADTAKFFTKLGADYWIGGPTDFKATVAAADRTISVAPGTAGGRGIFDTMATAANLSFDAVAAGTGTRWDMVAIRRDWQPVNGGPSALAVVKGSTLKSLPGGRLNNPGTQDDQPLWLVKLTEGSTAVTELVDLRCWYANGGLGAKDDLARSYLDTVGTLITVGSKQWLRRIGSNDTPEWVDFATLDDTGTLTSGVSITPQTNWTVNSYRLRRVGRTTKVKVTATYTGANVTTGAGGNFTDLNVATLTSAWSPTGDSEEIGASESGVRQWFGRITPSGNLQLTHGLPSQTLAKNTQVIFSGMYFND